MGKENVTDWPSRPPRTAKSTKETAARILLLAALYFGSGEISLSLSATSGIVTLVIFMAEGFGLAATVLWGRRVWPGIFIGQWALCLLHDMAWLPALGIAAVNSAEAVIGATLFWRMGIRREYDSTRDVILLLVLVVVVLQPLSATFGTGVLWLTGMATSQQMPDLWRSWWFGNLIGQIVVTPLLLVCHALDWRAASRKAWQPLLMILLMILLVFHMPTFLGANVSLAVMPFLMLMLAARHGMPAATLGTMLIMLTNLYFAHRGVNLFDGTNSGGFADLDLFLLSLALVGQFVAALMAERRRAGESLEVSRARLNEAQRIAGVGSWTLDLRANRLEWSDEIYRIFEIDQTRFAASYEAFLAAIHPDDRAMVDKAYTESVANRTPYQLIHRLRFADGRIKHVQERCETLYDDDGTPLLSRGTVLDVTAIKRAEDMLHIYARAFQQSGEAIMITDSDNNIVDVNPAFTALTGYVLDEVRSRNPRMLASGHTPRDVYPVLWQALNEKGLWQGELWDRRKDGSVYPKWATLSVLRDAAGNVVNHMASFVDIAERKAAEERMQRQAHHDALTGLPNRFSLEFRLDQALRAALRENAQLAVMFIDMDRFKIINDTLGHHVGDLLLVEVAKRLQASARSSDIVARLGGDEFVVVLTGGVDGVAATGVAAKIVDRLGQPYCLGEHNLKSSPSVGISLYPDHGEDAETLMRHADVAMYHAKEDGRGRFKMFSVAMTSAASERRTLEHDLREALTQKQFELYYQPQVNTGDSSVFCVEALARWRHPERGLLLPASFIPVIDRIGMAEEFGTWVLDEAACRLSAWRAHGIDAVRMAVNVSAGQLRSPGLVRIVEETMQRHGIRPGQLELEINEVVAMDNPERIVGQLNALRALGVELAIGNFGTGFSSLAHLRQLPIQTLKLDRAFVGDIGEIGNDENASAISAAVLAMAHNLGLKVVAEGVETEEQRAFLARHKCDLLQGYLFSKPLQEDEARTYIAQAAPAEDKKPEPKPEPASD